MEPTNRFDTTRTVAADQEREQQPIDFSHSRTLGDILKEVKRMKSRSETLPTSDGKHRFTPEDIAQRIEKAVRAALFAARDPEQPLLTRRLSPGHLDDLFAEQGITSTAGLREAMVRVMARASQISGEDLKLMREIRQEGEFNPIHTLPEDEFTRRYPREQVVERVTTTTPDLEAQVAIRWREIDRAKEQAGRAEQQRKLRDWEDARSRVVFSQEWITQPTAADGYKQYGQAQEANRTQRESKERAARGKNFARIEGVADYNSIANDIALMMGAARSEISYTGLNYAKGRDGRLEPKVTRTYSLPIEGAPGHVMTVTLFSEADIPERGTPREIPEHFQGVMVEGVDQLRAYAGERAQSAEQQRVVRLAREQMQKVEAQVRAKYGIDLGIDRKLATLL